MTKTAYDPTLFATVDLHKVRFFLGDTSSVPTQILFHDEEITGMIDMVGTPCMAAVRLAKQKALDVSKNYAGSRSIGDLSTSNGQYAMDWGAFAKDLEKWCRGRLNMSRIGQMADGTAYVDLPHLFRIGQHDGATHVWTPVNDPNFPLAASYLLNP